MHTKFERNRTIRGRVIDDLYFRRQIFHRGPNTRIDLIYQGCVDRTLPNLGRTQRDYRPVTSLLQNSDITLHFQTRAARSRVVLKISQISGGLSDFKLATGDVLKRIGTARRRAASSCNAFAIATFSIRVDKYISMSLLVQELTRCDSAHHRDWMHTAATSAESRHRLYSGASHSTTIAHSMEPVVRDSVPVWATLSFRREINTTWLCLDESAIMT